jgi:adenylosuccinate synthase
MALTKLDVLCGFDPIRIAVAYRLGGRRLDLFPADPVEAAVVEPIYETMPGWQGPLNAEQGMDGLPAAARRFVARIEKDLEVPIYLVSVGPERDQTIMTGQVN